MIHAPRRAGAGTPRRFRLTRPKPYMPRRACATCKTAPLARINTDLEALIAGLDDIERMFDTFEEDVVRWERRAGVEAPKPSSWAVVLG
ncbi:uncharacterized protein VTP21DRAFT_3117 [Calcarisporiella thermophila]|uniref:uncharacterized protein n=1 Tax=Calcarisporiella thermophila TaxID=911321 RepID=UPI003744B045